MNKKPAKHQTPIDIKKKDKIETFKEELPSSGDEILPDNKDFDDISESKKDIDEAVLHVLDRWYQAYLRIIIFIGSASGVVLLYVGINLIQIINDVEKGKTSIVTSSLETLLKTSPLATSEDSVPEKQLYKDTIENGKKGTIYSILQDNQSLIRIGIIFLTISLLSTIVCVLTTYNWYITGVSNLLKNAKNEDYLYKLIEDKLSYRNSMGQMRFWGRISLISGWVAGVSLGIGVFTYAFGIWDIIEELLHLG